MENKNKLYGWMVVVLVLLFAGVAIYAYHRNTERAASIPTASNLALYTNPTYGYNFYYPPEYTVRVASDENIIVGMATSSSFVEYAEARVATGSPQTGSYDDFVVSVATALCAEEKNTCVGQTGKETYTTETDLQGTKFYLNLTTPGGSPQRFGPLYAFNIGGNVTNAKYGTLIIYRPQNATGSVETFPAEDIAGKVQINKVTR